MAGFRRSGAVPVGAPVECGEAADTVRCMVESRTRAAVLRDAKLTQRFGTLFALLVTTFIVSGFSEYAWARATATILQLMMVAVAFMTTRSRDRKRLPIHGVSNEDYSYFSFVTLTTVGYGDLVAHTDLGRRIAVVEAMTGQIFLATAVARLVSLYGAEIRRTRRSDGSEDAEALEGA